MYLTRSTTRRTPPAASLLTAALLLAACEGSTGSDDRPSRISDPANDFLASFAGTRNADLDVRSAEVTYDGTDFVFRGAMAGAVGTTQGALYVWGINRGAGTARFPSLAPGVLFDAVVIIQPSGTSRVVIFNTTPPTTSNLAAANVTVSGNEVTARVPASLLPGQGFAFADYTVNLWPRTGAGNDNQIADFAPDNRNVPVRSR